MSIFSPLICADKNFDNLIHFEEYIILLKPFLDTVITNYTDEGILCDSRSYCKTCSRPLKYEDSKKSLDLIGNTNSVSTNSKTSSMQNSGCEEGQGSGADRITLVCTCPGVEYIGKVNKPDTELPEFRIERATININNPPESLVSINNSINRVPSPTPGHSTNQMHLNNIYPDNMYSSAFHYNDNQDRNLKILFNIYDRDKNGYITREEISEVMKGLGENLSETDLDEMMAGNKIIDFTQFKNLLLGDESSYPEDIMMEINTGLDGLSMRCGDKFGNSNVDIRDVQIVDNFINSPNLGAKVIKNEPITKTNPTRITDRSPSLEIEIIENKLAQNPKIDQLTTENGSQRIDTISRTNKKDRNNHHTDTKLANKNGKHNGSMLGKLKDPLCTRHSCRKACTAGVELTETLIFLVISNRLQERNSVVICAFFKNC